MPNAKILAIFIVVVLVVVGGVYYFSYQAGYGKGYDAGKEAGIAAQKTTAGAAVTNPLEQMPTTNPFEKAINPFKDLYTNPFK